MLTCVDLPCGYQLRVTRNQLWVRHADGRAERVDSRVLRERREILVAYLNDPAEMCEVVARAVCDAMTTGAKLVPVVGRIDAR